MTVPDMPAERPAAVRLEEPAGTRLRGRALVLARLTWVVIVSLTIGFFIAALPARFDELVSFSGHAKYEFEKLSPEEQQVLLPVALALDSYPVGILTLEIAVVLVLSLTAAVIIWRKSDDWLALFVSLAHVMYGTYITPPLDTLMVVQPAWHWLVNLLQAIGLGCALLFFYLLPDGRLVPSWTRLLTVIWIALTAVWGIVPSVPFNLSNPFTTAPIWFLMLMGWWFTGLLAQISRYRHAGPVQRRQTRPIVFCLAAGVLAYAAVYVAGVLLPPVSGSGIAPFLFHLFGIPLFLLLIIPIPIAISFAILRYHLFDIDVIIHRTLIYGPLTAALAFVYFGSVVLLQQLFLSLTGQTHELAIIISTLMMVVLFNPLRHRIQTFIDRRFYRHKYDAAGVLAAFSATLRDEVDLDRLAEEVVEVARETMQPTHVSFWLRPPAKAAPPGERPTPEATA